MLTTEQMVAFCGAHLIKELAYLRSFLPSCTEKDNHREGMALPCENPEGNHVKHIRMMTLYSHERYSHEEVEEVIEEIKPSLFSADASSSQHRLAVRSRERGLRTFILLYLEQLYKKSSGTDGLRLRCRQFYTSSNCLLQPSTRSSK